MSVAKELRKRFVNDVMSDKHNLEKEKQTETSGTLKAKVLTVAVQLPSGAIEVITNTEYLEDKIMYYLNAYDDEFRLVNNPVVQIVGYMLV